MADRWATTASGLTDESPTWKLPTGASSEHWRLWELLRAAALTAAELGDEQLGEIMALIADQPTPRPTEKEIFNSAMRQAMLAIRTAQEIGARYFYGPRGNRHTLAEMQRRVDEYGSDAAALFATSGLLAQVSYLAAGIVPDILPNGIGYTANEDGTVTLTGAVDEPPPVIEPPEVPADG